MILKDVIIKYKGMVWDEYGVNIYGKLTATSIAYSIFKTKYLNEVMIEIPQTYHDEFIRCAYYGGRCEVYSPVIKENTEVFHYDYNSCYPFSMLKPLPTTIKG